MNTTKIVCTLGPASESRETIESLVAAGMRVARFNASHGDTDERAALIERVRAVDAANEASVATMLDLSGPEVRTASLEESLDLATGSTVEFVEGAETTPERIGLSESITEVDPGDAVLLNDGRIETTVESVEGENGGRARVGRPVARRTRPGSRRPSIGKQYLPMDCDRSVWQEPLWTDSPIRSRTSMSP